MRERILLTGFCKHDFKPTANSKARGVSRKLHFCRTYQRLGDSLGMPAMGKTVYVEASSVLRSFWAWEGASETALTSTRSLLK